MRVDLRLGRFTVGQQDVTLSSRHRTGLPAVVYLGGLSQIPADAINGFYAASMFVRRFATEGFPVVIPNVAALWDNATGQQRITDALAYARSSMGASNDPAIIVGISHGGSSAIHYSMDHNEETRCVVSLIPAVDWNAVRDTNPVANIRSTMDAAWGVVHPAPLPLGTSPIDRTTDLTDIPIQIWYSNSDGLSTNVPAFDSALPLCESHDVGATGHGEASLSAVNLDSVMSFVRATL